MSQQKSWKTNLVFLTVLWIVLLIASVTILSSVITPFLRSLHTTSITSSAWSGYSISSNPISTLPMMTGVSASWTVPAVSVSTANTYSAAWIGIGGQGEPTLIQTGTQHNSVGGQASYSLWYELLPDNAITIPGIEVTPGDLISASITLANNDANEWTIEISDVSKGQTFRANFVYSSSRLSAEWIMERPTVNNQLTTLADFGSVTFKDISVQVGSRTGNLDSFPNFVIVMHDFQNRNLVSVAPYSQDGSSFTVTYTKR